MAAGAETLVATKYIPALNSALSLAKRYPQTSQ
jgi:hypothetical protein